MLLTPKNFGAVEDQSLRDSLLSVSRWATQLYMTETCVALGLRVSPGHRIMCEKKVELLDFVQHLKLGQSRQANWNSQSGK